MRQGEFDVLRDNQDDLIHTISSTVQCSKIKTNFYDMYKTEPQIARIPQQAISFVLSVG